MIYQFFSQNSLLIGLCLIVILVVLGHLIVVMMGGKAFIVTVKGSQSKKAKETTYDIRCRIPGETQYVIQDVPREKFHFEYPNMVYAEKDGQSFYFPTQYTTIQTNE